MLTLVTWAGIFIVCGLYDAVFTLEGYSLLVAIVWLPKFLFGSILMFLTVSPFVFVAMKTKGFVAPMIGSAVIVMEVPHFQIKNGERCIRGQPPISWCRVNFRVPAILHCCLYLLLFLYQQLVFL